jgi:transcriptional regulator with XRE-family HTH domain
VDKPKAEITGGHRFAMRTEKAAALLREFRLAQKMTQAALARELGVIANTVARWERGEVPIPHWTLPYLELQRRVAELTSALAERKKTQKELRGTIEAKNFELQVEKAIGKASKGPTADQLHSALCKAFLQDRTTLLAISEIYLTLTRTSKTIEGELYSVDSQPRTAGNA